MSRESAAADLICKDCGFWQNAEYPDLHAVGSDTPYLYVVGGGVSGTDEASEKPFSGQRGDLVHTAEEIANTGGKAVRFYNSVNCNLGEKPDPSAVEFCAKKLVADIEKAQPKVILCLGSAAVRALFPNAPDVANNPWFCQGYIVPYKLQSGRYVPVLITFDEMSVLQAATRISASTEATFVRHFKEALELDPDQFADLNPACQVIPCTTFDKVEECFARVKEAKTVAFDIETTLALKPYPKAPEEREIYSISFAFDDGVAYAIPVHGFGWPKDRKLQILRSLGAWCLAYPDQVKVAHNLGFDLTWLLYKCSRPLKQVEAWDLEPQGHYEDTALLTNVLDTRIGASRLDGAAWRYLGVDDWSIRIEHILSYPIEQVLHYNALDAHYTLQLYRRLMGLLKDDSKLMHVYTSITRPAQAQFIKVELQGCPVDIPTLTKLTEEYAVKLENLLHALRDETALPNLNPGSTKMIGAYFGSKSSYDLPKTKAGNVSVNAHVLQQLVDKHGDPVARMLLEYRNLSKMYSTYLSGLDKFIHDDNCLHASFSMTTTVTGRTSSSAPNMQNFPARKDAHIRRIIKAPEGWQIVKFDYGQIEFRLQAVLSGDMQLVEDLINGYDIHLEKAIDYYHRECGWTLEEAKRKRQDMKAGLVFAGIYGSSHHSIAANLGTDPDTAQRLLDSIFDRYPKIKEWQQGQVEFEERNGYVESLFGRRRKSPLAFTEILNMPAQSSASDITLLAMNAIARKYRVLMMIHDDVTCLLPDDNQLQDSVVQIAQTMLSVPWAFMLPDRKQAWAPLEVEVSAGQNWADQKKLLKVSSLEAGMKDELSSLQVAEKMLGSQRGFWC